MKTNIKNKIIVALIAVTLLLVSSLLLVGCNDNPGNNEHDKVVTGITLDMRNAQTDFFVGDTFSTLGLGIVVHYEDGSSSLKLASGDDVDVLAPDLGAIGTKDVYVSYGGFTTNYSVNVSRVDSIELNLSNVRLVYMVGDEFSAAGLGVSAKITSLNSLNNEVSSFKKLGVTDYTVSTPDMSTSGDKTVTVTYLDKSADFTIRVISDDDPKVLVGIDWNVKTDYLVGDEFQCAPARKYHDGSTEPLSADEYTVSVVDMSTIGVKTVTLTYLADSSYDITVQIYCIPDVPWETNKLDFGYDQNGSGATLELFVTERSARHEDGAYWGTSDQTSKGWLLVKHADGTYEMYEYEFYLAWDVSSHPYPNGTPEGVSPDGVSSRVPAGGQQYGDNLVIEINGMTFVAFDNNLWHLIVIGWQ